MTPEILPPPMGCAIPGMMKAPILLALASTLSHAQEAKPSPTKPEIGKPFVIDGIEITLSNPRVGGETDKQPEKGALPEAKFYKLTFKLRNATENKILTVQQPWSKTRLKDEHGNVYRAERVGQDDSAKLRPGKETVGVIYFEVPLASAKDLTLTIDPGIYRDGEDGLLHELSKDSAELKLTNPTRKP